MTDWQGRSNRDGLSSRARLNGDGHLQINVEGEFDFDKEIEGLRSQVGRLKHVCSVYEVLSLPLSDVR